MVDAPPSEEWPEGGIVALIETDLVTPRTRAVLRERLASSSLAASRPGLDEAGCLNRDERATLAAVTARLVPQPVPMTDIASSIDRRLASGEGDGWRYDVLPPDGEAMRAGLAAIEDESGLRFGQRFTALDADCQATILTAVEGGSVVSVLWAKLPPSRFFEDLLAMAVEVHYSHPSVQDSIGYAGMADARGWTAIGLDEREAHEPQPLARRSS